MKMGNKITSALIFFMYIFLKRCTPIACRINLTYRCPRKCKYCNVWKDPPEEMTTEQIFSLIDQLKEMKCQMISFSGGEPMLRDDIGEIINYATSKGISTSINNSGAYFDKKAKEIKDIGLVEFSLDGTKENNDYNRGTGSFDSIMVAVETAKSKGIPFCFNATLTNKTATTDDIYFLLNLAKKNDTYVIFQPYKEIFEGVRDYSLLPDVKKFRSAIDFLIEKKKVGYWSPHIRNSMRSLKHIRSWPNYKNIDCRCGDLFIIVNPNGDVVPCDRSDMDFSGKVPNFLNCGLKKAFENLPKLRCSGCGFSGGLELTFMSKLYPDVILDIIKFI